MNYKNFIRKFAWVLFGLIIIGLVCILQPKYRLRCALQNKKSFAIKENYAIEEQTKELKIKRKRFKSDPNFVVRTAYENGMVKPGDTVFKFTNEQSRTRNNH